MFKTFTQFIIEAGGQKSGQFEILKVTPNQAYEIAKQYYDNNRLNIDIQIPDFKNNFQLLQNLVRIGWKRRKDMPVIGSKQVKQFQQALKKGKIDIEKPYAEFTNPEDPFPEGLSNEKAKKWLEAGFLDNQIKDDQLKVKKANIRVKDIRPVQNQIYFDKIVERISENTKKQEINNIQQKYLILNNNNFLIDGHHRWASATLLEPDVKLNAIQIDLEVDDLLDLANSYGDAIGNKKNK